MLSRRTRKMPYAGIWHKQLSEHGGTTGAHDLITRIVHKYNGLCTAQRTVSHRGLLRHLQGNIFPQMAAYAVLKEEMAPEEALLRTQQLHFLSLSKVRRCHELLSRVSIIYTCYRILVPLVLKFGHPSAGWSIEWIENSSTHICARVHRCFYYDVMKAYGTPELITVYCNGDDHVFKEISSPYIEWGRTSTMPRGGDYCDVVYHSKVKMSR